MATIQFCIRENETYTIDSSSGIPKYRQLANIIINQIKQGEISSGDKLSSISQTSVNYLLSRDTVEKAYQLLQKEGYIYSVYRSGFYVAVQADKLPTKVCIVAGQMSEAASCVYNALLDHRQLVSPQLCLHHYQIKRLQAILSDNLNKGFFDYFVVFPQLQACDEELAQCLQIIPAEKLILLDKPLKGLKGHSVIARNYSQDLFAFFEKCNEEFLNYSMAELILPEEYFPAECITVFKLFCEKYQIDYRLTDDLEKPMKAGKLYVTISENSLISVLKTSNEKKYRLGKDIGVIALGTTSYRHVFDDQIASFSYDYCKTAKRILELIDKKQNMQVTIEANMQISASI